MEEYLQGNYTESIQQYEKIIQDEKEHLAEAELGMIYCNIAAAEFGLELFRKCIQSCEISINYDKSCMRAYLIQAAAYIATKKYMNAKESCLLGISNVNNFTDSQMAKQLKEYLAVVTSLTGEIQASSKVISNQASQTPTTAVTVTKNGKGSSSSTSKQPAVTMEQLIILRDEYISETEEPGKVQKCYLAAARQSLTYATGEEVVDDLIGFGYLLVNSNRLNESEELFSVLLQYNSNLYAGHLALGTVYALQGKLAEATKTFSTAISISPREVDAWKRRGQTQAALGRHMDALDDYNHALTFSNDPEIYYQRGLLYQQMKNFRRGIADYLKHNELTTSRTCQLFNNMGICQSQLGDIENAIISFKNAYQEDETFLDAFLNHAQMFKEIGHWREAEVLYDEILMKFLSQIHRSQVEKVISQLYFLRSNLQYSLGHPLLALGYAKRYVDLMFDTHEKDGDREKKDRENVKEGDSGTQLVKRNPNSRVFKKDLYQMKDLLQGYGLMATNYLNLGNFTDALKYFNLILLHDSENVCRVQKAIMFYYYSHLDANPTSFNLDRDVDPRWKEIWAKGLPANILDIPDSPLEKVELIDLDSPENIINMTTLTPQQEKIVELANRFGPWVQINSRGFLPNVKLHRGFGLAIIEMAHALLTNIDTIHRTGSPMMISNSASSSKYFTHDGQHPFGYRDLFDIIVKWRQISEPNDPVWWIDGLPRESFEEGFGLQTPMISGQLRCLRYYSYFKMGFEVLRTQASSQYFLASSIPVIPSKNAKKKIKKATTLKELHSIVGQDFYIVCPCQSIANQNLQTTVLEGTRLTVLKKEPEGFEFSIRCPSLPIRWKAMSDEMRECYERMILSLYHLRYPEDNPHLDSSPPDPLYHSLQLFYYWTNFSPLTRGSAFCGYGVLFAIVLSFGYQIISPIPEGKQFDWEAIFTAHPEVFIQNMKSLFKLEVFNLEEILQFNGSMGTLREMLKLLHYNLDRV